MKKLLFVLFIVTALSSCKKDLIDKVVASKGLTPVNIHFSMDQNYYENFI